MQFDSRFKTLFAHNNAMNKFQQLRDTIVENQRLYALTKLEGSSWIKRRFYGFISFISILYSETDNFKIFIRAASGTYNTMLALVPFMVVGGSLILTFNKSATIPSIVAQINEYVIPVAGDTIATFLSESLTRTLDLGLGPIGLISLLVTSVMLFVHIEDCFNDIWHVPKPRAFYLRILIFYAIVTLGPIIFSFSIYQATQLFPENFIVSAFVWKIIREILIFTAFCTVVFKFLPNARVDFKYAIIPAFIVALILEALKFFFSFYLNIAFRADSNYSILYGAIGIIPFTLLWLYLSWVILLYGVSTSYCMQNMQMLIRSRLNDSPNTETWTFLGAYAPIEVLSALVRNLCSGAPPMTTDELATECAYPSQAIQAILAKFKELGIVNIIDGEYSKSYILARPLDAILINEVVAKFDESTPRARKHPKLHAFVEQLVAAQKQIWANSNANVLREDGVALQDVSQTPTTTLHIEGADEAEGNA